MTSTPLVFVSHDRGLLDHWQGALAPQHSTAISSYAELSAQDLPAGSLVWLDHALPDLPGWQDERWAALLARSRLVFASGRPEQGEAVAALAAGCAAYCHAFADGATLLQVKQVVEAGHIWVGKELMQQLLSGVRQVLQPLPPPVDDWASGLTDREQEIARLAANGESNREIARRCDITERTVKAHLAAVFSKLHLVDRLQLALHVHGIRKQEA